MFYNESQIVRAFNDGLDLKNKVLEYLGALYSYANGVNNIRLKKENIRFIYLHNLEEDNGTHFIKVSLQDTKYSSYSVFVPDDDPDYEGYSQPGHYEEGTTSYKVYDWIRIPLSHLQWEYKEMVEYFSKLKIKWDMDEAEKQRQKEISELKEKLIKLEANIATPN